LKHKRKNKNENEDVFVHATKTLVTEKVTSAQRWDELFPSRLGRLTQGISTVLFVRKAVWNTTIWTIWSGEKAITSAWNQSTDPVLFPQEPIFVITAT
jgi:hypothetical protein